MLRTLWTVFGASVAGASHRRLGQPCQDAHGFRVLPSGWLVIAVADGAGAASLGMQGARLAVSASLKALSRSLTSSERAIDDAALRAVLTCASYAARARIEREACHRQVASAKLACTLTLVLAHHDIVAVVQVGDGAAVGASGDDGEPLMLLAEPQRGEHAGETNFLVSVGAVEASQAKVFHEVDALAVFSDGVAHVALQEPGATPHGPFFYPLFGYARTVVDANVGRRKMASFLRAPRIMERTGDDLTLVLAVRQ